MVNTIIKLKSRSVETVPKLVPEDPKKSSTLELPDKPPPMPKEHYLMTKLQLIEGDFPLEIPGLEVTVTDKDVWKVS
jgi:hypothetical protein